MQREKTARRRFGCRFFGAKCFYSRNHPDFGFFCVDVLYAFLQELRVGGELSGKEEILRACRLPAKILYDHSAQGHL